MILRFVQGSEPDSQAIVLLEKTAMPFTPSHVEALSADGTSYIGAMLDGGVQRRPIGYDTGKMNHELLLTLDATAQQDALFNSFLEGHLGESYDWQAIVGFVVPLREHALDHAICSALITLALRGCSWFPFPLAVPAHLINPRDLLLMISARVKVPM